MEKIAFLFTGQGSQYIGMGKSLYDEFNIAKQTYEEASDVLGFDLKKVCFEGSISDLSKTENTQVALLTNSVSAFRVFTKEIGIRPQFLAGHSLGEYSALVCAGVLNFSDGLQIVRKRGLLSQEIINSDIGAMTIVDGLPIEVVQEECENYSTDSKFVKINCYNAPTQVTIAGHKELVEKIEERLLELDGQITPLLMSAPFHTPLMENAALQLKNELVKYTFKQSRYPIVSNGSVLPYSSPERISDQLVKQMTKQVRWKNTMEFLDRYGVTLAIEMGPQKILTNLVQLNNLDDMQSFCYGQREERNILTKHLLTQEDLMKHVPNVLTKCLAAAVSTPNSNYDEKEYCEGVEKPYNEILKMYDEIGDNEADFNQKKKALELLKVIFNTKKVTQEEQDEWFNDIVEETGNTYELLDVIKELKAI